jgi:hypothetical protein
LPVENRQFFLGCCAGHLVMQFVLMLNLPYTPRQPRNRLFGWVAFSFLPRVMTVCARRWRSGPWKTAPKMANTRSPMPGWKRFRDGDSGKLGGGDS